MNYDDVLTQKTAVAIAREWIDGRIVRPKDHLRSQMRGLMEQLATRCIAESLQQQEKEDQLCERLDAAWDILNSVWYAAAPEYATRWRIKAEEQPGVDEQKKIEQARHVVWTRRDPKRSFQDGFESKHHFNYDRNSLDSTIANYLERSWLRHPTLDWILLDMTITRELCAFGEELKKRWVPGKRDDLDFFHHRYFSTKGNLSKMTEIKWSEFFESLWTKFVTLIAIPVGAIWASFHYGYSGLGATLASIYGVLVAGYGGIKVIQFLLRGVNRLIGRPDPRLKPFLLWEDMYEVWRRLDGPVVNPSRVRESMAKSTDKGAVWDAISWSLIDRLIAIDPAVWVIQPAAAQ
jgi:hypothetical protein